MYLIYFNVEIFLGFSILNLILLPLFLKIKKKNKTDLLFNLFIVCKNIIILILFFTLILLLNNFFLIYSFHGYNYFTNVFINVFKFIMLVSLFIMLLMVNIVEINKVKFYFPYGIYEFFILVLFNIFGLFFFLSAENFLMVYLGIELHSLTLSILFGLRYFTKFSTESALKYFIISSFSSSIFLFGVSFFYGLFGFVDLENIILLNFFDNFNMFSSGFFIYDYYLSNSIVFSLLFIIISILIKLGSAPFHMWAIDVYDGAPNFITLYAMIIPKIAYIGFFIKMFFYFQSLSFLFFFLFKYCGFLSLLFGTFGALIQTKIKRILAYSAVANFGYILLCLSTGQLDGVIACLLFLITYVIVTCNIFFILFTLISITDSSELKTIFQLKSLLYSGKRHISFLLAILFFTLSSIPPSNIFISKYFLLYSIIQDFSFYSIILTSFIFLSNVVGCFYYIRIIRLIFFNYSSSYVSSIPYIKLNFLKNFLISMLTVLNIFFFFYPQLLLDFFDYIFLCEINLVYFFNIINIGNIFPLCNIITL